MKTLILSLGVAGLLFLAGCSDDANVDARAGNGGGSGSNLQAFVVNNCNNPRDGQPRSVNGASFPGGTSDDDPAQSVYTRNCLNQ